MNHGIAKFHFGTLKPCPFCGGEVIMMYNSLGNTYNVYHKDFTDCFLREPIEIEGEKASSLNEAVEIWNRRR